MTGRDRLGRHHVIKRRRVIPAALCAILLVAAVVASGEWLAPMDSAPRASILVPAFFSVSLA